MGQSSERPNELREKALGSFGRDYPLYELCSFSCGKTTWGHAICSKDHGNCLVFWFVQRSHCTKALEAIRQDWKYLVLMEIKSLEDPSTSEGYVRWRDLVALTTINEEGRSPQTEEKPVKRKGVDNEEELRRQIEKLQIELVLEGDKRRSFLNEQLL